MHNQNPFKLTSSREVYKNPWITVREDSVIRPGGSAGIFGVIDMKHGVTVVALTPEHDVLLAREFKYAVGYHTLECFSGGIDGGEEPLAAAQRELLEESGAHSDDWHSFGVVDPLTSILHSPGHIFLAQNCTIEHDQQTEPGEIIEILRMPLTDALEKIERGEITHAASVVGLLRTARLLGV